MDVIVISLALELHPSYVASCLEGGECSIDRRSMVSRMSGDIAHELIGRREE